MKKFILSVLSLCFIANVAVAQEQGYIKMEITEVESDNAEMSTYLEMMKGTETEYMYTDDKSMVKANMMGGMVEMTTIVANADESMVMYMNAMGKKMQIESTKEERDMVEAKSQQEAPEFTIEYDENVTKEILGHKCIKAVVTFDNPDSEENMSMDMFVAPDLKMSSKMIQGLDKVDIKGFPLEYIMDAGMMKMTVTATEFKEEVDVAAFEFNSKGYQKLTWEEFSEQMSQMGGGF